MDIADLRSRVTNTIGQMTLLMQTTTTYKEPYLPSHGSHLYTRSMICHLSSSKNSDVDCWKMAKVERFTLSTTKLGVQSALSALPCPQKPPCVEYSCPIAERMRSHPPPISSAASNVEAQIIPELFP